MPSPNKSRKRTPDWRPDKDHALCRLADMPDAQARGFMIAGPQGERLDVIVWRHGDHLRGFVNQCPHLGLPLETFPDRFLSLDGTHLICSAHGAKFDTDGTCFAGPCQGAALARVSLRLEDGDAAQDGDKHIVLCAPQGHSEV